MPFVEEALIKDNPNIKSLMKFTNNTPTRIHQSRTKLHKNRAMNSDSGLDDLVPSRWSTVLVGGENYDRWRDIAGKSSSAAENVSLLLESIHNSHLLSNEHPHLFSLLWLLLWDRVAVEMQESPSHNFGQLAVEPLESTSRCCVDSFLVVNSPLTPSHQPQLQSQVNWSRLKDGGRRKETSVRQEKGWVGPGWGEGRRQTNHDYLLHKEGKFRLWESDLLTFPQWLPMHARAHEFNFWDLQSETVCLHNCISFSLTNLPSVLNHISETWVKKERRGNDNFLHPWGEFFVSHNKTSLCSMKAWHTWQIHFISLLLPDKSSAIQWILSTFTFLHPFAEQK